MAFCWYISTSLNAISPRPFDEAIQPLQWIIHARLWAVYTLNEHKLHCDEFKISSAGISMSHGTPSFHQWLASFRDLCCQFQNIIFINYNLITVTFHLYVNCVVSSHLLPAFYELLLDRWDIPADDLLRRCLHAGMGWPGIARSDEVLVEWRLSNGWSHPTAVWQVQFPLVINCDEFHYWYFRLAADGTRPGSIQMQRKVAAVTRTLLEETNWNLSVCFNNVQQKTQFAIAARIHASANMNIKETQMWRTPSSIAMYDILNHVYYYNSIKRRRERLFLLFPFLHFCI